VLVRIIPLITERLPETVYLTDMQLGWMEPGEAAANMAGAVAAPARRPGPPGPGGMPPPSAPPARAPATAPGFSQKSDAAVVGVSMGCESLVIPKGETYIQDYVIRPLQDLMYPNTTTPIFQQVARIGNLTSIYRGADGVPVSADVYWQHPNEVLQLVSFRLFGVIHTMATRQETALAAPP